MRMDNTLNQPYIQVENPTYATAKFVGNAFEQTYGQAFKSTSEDINEEFKETEDNAQELKRGILGMGFLNDDSNFCKTKYSYGMVAKYADNFSESNPVIKVLLTRSANNIEEYEINIKDVNPQSASEIEMFALCCYADSIGKGTKGTFGSWHTLKYYQTNASDIGNFEMSNTKEDFISIKKNWLQMVNFMTEEYEEAGIYKQVLDGKELLNMFDICIENNKTEINITKDSKVKNNETESIIAKDSKVKNNKTESGITENIKAEDAKIQSDKAEIDKTNIDKELYFKNTDENKVEEYKKILDEKIKEFFVKVKNGDTEPSYQIGARSFTEKEWGELIEKFDSAQEAIKEIMKEEQKQREAEQVKAKEKAKSILEDETDMLALKTSICNYSDNITDEDSRKFYITCYTEQGIFCKKGGINEEYEWFISFDNSEQYKKVINFIERFPSDWNFRFAAHKNFWTDFLNDDINIDAFMNFMEETNKGIPDYSIVKGDSMYIDKEKLQWAKYLNPLETEFYTQEEFLNNQAEIITKNAAKMHKITDPYEDLYKKYYPLYNGEKIFCEYPGGPLYTANEISELMYERWLQTGGLNMEERSVK